MAGFDEMYRFSGRLRDFPVAARPLIKELMDTAGAEGEARSRSLAPVRTGNLKSRVQFRATTDRGWTFLLKALNDADYATFVELGTSRMAPQPFMMPGVELAADEIETALSLIMGEYL